MNNPLTPSPIASTIAPNPSVTPRRCGSVRRKPKLAPEASNIMLLGPGVIDDTKQNVASAMTMASLMGCYSCPFFLALGR